MNVALPSSAFYARAPLYLAGLLALAVLGFYQSYFARLLSANVVHHLHGITATAPDIVVRCGEVLHLDGLDHLQSP